MFVVVDVFGFEGVEIVDVVEVEMFVWVVMGSVEVEFG